MKTRKAAGCIRLPSASFSVVVLLGIFLGSPLIRAASAPSALSPTCVAVGATHPICGFDGPEDLAPTPDGRYVVASELPQDQAHPRGPFFRKIEIDNGLATALDVSYAPEQGWGDASCTSPAAVGLSTHGIDVSTRTDGRVQLLAVNHAQRESIEAFELKDGKGGLHAIWHGCASLATGAFNDVAALRSGGFVATVMLDKALVRNGNAMDLMFSGADTGYLAEWHPGRGYQRLPGSEAGVNNGIQISPDEHYVYFTAWSTKKILRYDRKQGRVDRVTELSMFPDNITIGGDGTMLVAGLDDLKRFHDCTLKEHHFCDELLGFSVVAIDTATMQARTVYEVPTGVMAGGSVALKMQGALYLGSYAGDRVVKVTSLTPAP